MTEYNHEQWKALHGKQSAMQELGSSARQEDKIDNYFFIFDCIDNNMLFTNASFTTITGYDATKFSVEQLVDIIHPEDLEYFFSSEEKGLAFTNKLKFNEHFQYLLTYSYRIRKASGAYITIQQQCQAIEVNEYGHLSKTLVTHKKIADYQQRPSNDYKIFDKVSNFYLDIENRFSLSNRELQIVSLIKEGKSSLDISVELGISKHTIDTHRKNILNKSKSANFIELFRKLSFQD